ncbi:hypothetical protein HPB50_012388 [Hyalomma asiaticum]|uniref:Uncharacterized protein n=1 Tax=Hyalomma asiaticum TaxID=266040 RepID=A0ACB7S119_HYAAI|nr:hypothetical protein HPB50_012388 [Hyalomma asiaticum]
MTDNGTGDPTSRDEASTIAVDVEQRSLGPRPQPRTRTMPTNARSMGTCPSNHYPGNENASSRVARRLKKGGSKRASLMSPRVALNVN